MHSIYRSVVSPNLVSRWLVCLAILLVGVIACMTPHAESVRSTSPSTATAAEPQPAAPPALPRKVDWAVVVHGGALDEVNQIPAERQAAMKASLLNAAKLGREVLEKGGTALDAVERVARQLEDDPLFNAGKGAVYNAVGAHELDASIMDGATKACGAVAGVRTVKNPISLARLVMTRTRHVLLIGDGAEQFADQQKVDRVDNKYFDTDYQYQRWQAKLKAEAQQKPGPADKKGTIGCVALDRHGNLAAATSTGGLTNKRFGRVGDSPIIGAGTYADNTTCAVSCTGTGEEFIRHGVSHDIHARVKYARQPLGEAVSDVLRKVLKPEDGGIIALGADGTIVMDFNTDGLCRAAADSTGRLEAQLAK